MFNCLLLSLLPHINTAAAVVSRPRELHWCVLLIYYIFMHLADAFIQSDLQCIQAIYFFYQYVCSLGIEPTIFCAANAMFYHWATGTRITHYACYGGIFWAFMCVRIIYHLFDTKQQHFWPPHTSIPIFLSRYRQLTGFWDTTQYPPVTQQFRGHLFSDITHLESSGLPEIYIYIKIRGKYFSVIYFLSTFLLGLHRIYLFIHSFLKYVSYIPNTIFNYICIYYAYIIINT